MNPRRRWLWLLLLIPVGLGFVRLRLDVDVFNLLPDHLSSVRGLKLQQEHFSNGRELIIVLQGSNSPAAESLAKEIAESLRSNTNLARRVHWQPPWLENPGQSAELIAYLWLNQPPGKFRDLVDSLAPDRLEAILEATRSRLSTSMSPDEIARDSYDPFGLTRLPESTAAAGSGFGKGQGIFSSDDGTVRVLFVEANVELVTYRQCQSWLDSIREIVMPKVSPQSGVAVSFTGRPAFVSEISAQMESDMKVSVGSTAVIIAALFWLAHRRLIPMVWLLILLAAVLISTLAIGGLLFGSISVVSMGFAAILLGLAVDYAVVHYQEALAHPEKSIRQIRRAIAPSILWAAITTIAAFAMLNFGGLPGLGQLGTLVAIGVSLAAVIMVFEYLPPLFPGRWDKGGIPLPAVSHPSLSAVKRLTPIIATAGLVLFALIALLNSRPELDATANALRPRNSDAYAALDLVKKHLAHDRDPVWLITEAPSPSQLVDHLRTAESHLTNAVGNIWISDYKTPFLLMPRSEFQETNKSLVRILLSRRTSLHEAAAATGFTQASLAYADQVFDEWQWMATRAGLIWPTNPLSQWTFEKFLARTQTNWFALSLVQPVIKSGQTDLATLRNFEATLPRATTWLSGWELLGQQILAEVKRNLWKTTVPIIVLVIVSLGLAFRNLFDVLLSLAVLSLSGACLLAVMGLAGWSWNLLNLMATPLILGTGVDYSIFTLLALRRFDGDARATYQSVGRALLLCGGTAITGFAALGFSSNAGMASLGRVCAVGIAANMLIAIFLLPWWARWLSRSGRPTAPPDEPSSLYRHQVWKLGLRLSRAMPERVCLLLGRVLADLYFALASHRREVLIRNLMPPLKNDVVAARSKARQLVRNFAIKIFDLWRYESGQPVEKLLGDATGWDYFESARNKGRGVLLLTPHLGNWEFGGPWLAKKGVNLQVVTLAEPGGDQAFTKLRQASRARWNIDTLVIRNDPFAFLEVIKRLEAGATVALLIDRPPLPTATKVAMFGQPFLATVAAAELARATGCALLPVYLPREGNGYQAHILPPIEYDRPALRHRLERQRVTQTIVAVFEPVIARYLDQWYHFVPVWPGDDNEKQLNP